MWIIAMTAGLMIQWKILNGTRFHLRISAQMQQNIFSKGTINDIAKWLFTAMWIERGSVEIDVNQSRTLQKPVCTRQMWCELCENGNTVCIKNSFSNITYWSKLGRWKQHMKDRIGQLDAKPHITLQIRHKLVQFSKDCLLHLPYSSNFASLDYQIFRCPQKSHNRKKNLNPLESCKIRLDQFIAQKDAKIIDHITASKMEEITGTKWHISAWLYLCTNIDIFSLKFTLKTSIVPNHYFCNSSQCPWQGF